MYGITPPCYTIMHVYCTDCVLNNMVFCWRILLDTLMQMFVMLRQLVADISRFKFDNYRVIHTGASDLKLFVGGVYRSLFDGQCLQPTGSGIYADRTARHHRIWIVSINLPSIMKDSENWCVRTTTAFGKLSHWYHVMVNNQTETYP